MSKTHIKSQKYNQDGLDQTVREVKEKLLGYIQEGDLQNVKKIYRVFKKKYKLNEIQYFKSDDCGPGLESVDMPLMFAAIYYHQPHILKYFLRKGEWVFDMAIELDLALTHFAVLYDIEMLKIVTDQDGDVGKKAPINCGNSKGRTALHLAIMKGDEQDVMEVLNCGAKLTPKDTTWRTAMHWAAISNCPKKVQHLLDHGGDPNVWDEDFNTPLHLAVKGWSVEIVTIMAKVSDLTMINKDGFTALELAKFEGFEDMVSILVGAGAKESSMGNDGDVFKEGSDISTSGSNLDELSDWSD